MAARKFDNDITAQRRHLYSQKSSTSNLSGYEIDIAPIQPIVKRSVAKTKEKSAISPRQSQQYTPQQQQTSQQQYTPQQQQYEQPHTVNKAASFRSESYEEIAFSQSPQDAYQQPVDSTQSNDFLAYAHNNDTHLSAIPEYQDPYAYDSTANYDSDVHIYDENVDAVFPQQEADLQHYDPNYYSQTYTASPGMDMWETLFDAVSQSPYYWNRNTGETTWELPASSQQQESFPVDSSETSQQQYDTSYTAPETTYETPQPSYHTQASLQRAESNVSAASYSSHYSAKNLRRMKSVDSHIPPSYNAPLVHIDERITERSTGSWDSLQSFGGDKVYSPSVRQSQTLPPDESSSDDDSMMGIRKGADMFTQAYSNINIVEELLEDEEARMNRKFNLMKVNGTILREADEWQEWQSEHGAVFYSRIKQQGGQWKPPAVFQRAENMRTARTPSKYAREPQEQEAQKAVALSMLIDEWENHGSNNINNDDIENYIADQLVEDVHRVKTTSKQQLPLALNSTVTGHNLIAPPSHRNRYTFDGVPKEAEIDQSTKGIKEIYQALRDRESYMDEALDVRELKRRTDEAKIRWKEFIEMNEASEQPVIEDDSDDDVMDFNKLTKRSIIVKQRWPWTVMVDIQTDRQFYRNEETECFQFDPPPEFDETLPQYKKVEAKQVERSKVKRKGLMGNMRDFDTNVDTFISDAQSSIQNEKALLQGVHKTTLPENYKKEIVARREHYLKLRKKVTKTVVPPGSAVQNAAKSELSAAQNVINKLKMSAASSSAGTAPVVNHAGSRRSVFSKGRLSTVGKRNVKSSLSSGLGSIGEEYAPPEKYNAKSRDDKNMWRDLSEIQKRKNIDIVDLSWHDAQVLLCRVRRLAELKAEEEPKKTVLERSVSSLAARPKSPVEPLPKIEEEHVPVSQSHSAHESSSFKSLKSFSVKSQSDVAMEAELKRLRTQISLQELQKTAASKRVSAHTVKVHNTQIQLSVAALSASLDIDDISLLDTEIVRRHLLEAATLLKHTLVRPMSVRDKCSYNFIPSYVLCPEALTMADILNTPTKELTEMQRWMVVEYEHFDKKLYVYKRKGKVQEGIPFDVKCKEKREVRDFKRLRWYDYGIINTQQNSNRNASLELMSDEHGGMLFYCPVRKFFSWHEKIDASFYDVPVKPKKDKDGQATTESKTKHVYLPRAVIENRVQNIWADLHMTKLHNPRLAALDEDAEEEESKSRKKDVRPTDTSTVHSNKTAAFLTHFQQILELPRLEKDTKGCVEQMDEDALEYEDELSTGDYEIYCGYINKLADDPLDIATMLQFAEFLHSKHLGKEALTILIRVLEVAPDKAMPSLVELAMIILCMAKLTAKYLSEFRLLYLLKEVVLLCPTSPVILAMTARIYHMIQMQDTAEILYVGSLLTDPLCSIALHGYGLLLAEKGNIGAAGRYMARVSEASHLHAISKIELGWIQEIHGAKEEAIHLAYQSVLSLGLKNKTSALALASLGHFYHVRGDSTRALDFYRRSRSHNPNSAHNLLLFGCMYATVSLLNVAENDEIDASFRRGLFFLKGSNRWIGLLAYAEFTICKLRDAKRAEEIYWEAASISCMHSVWASIALAHFYQYVRNDIVTARRVLLWAAKRSELPVIREAENDSDDEEESVDSREAQKKEAADMENVSDKSCVAVAHAFLHFDMKDYRGSLQHAKSSLKYDAKCSAAHRCVGLIYWYQGKRAEGLHSLKAAVEAAPHNPYALRSFAVASALVGNYEDALNSIRMATQVDATSMPLQWRAMGIMNYLYDSSNREYSLICFDKAFELSRGLDFEAYRLKAQVLMELGKFEEAEKALRQILPLQPCDSLALACLALSLVAQGVKSPTGIHKINYDLKIKLMDTPHELVKCRDPEELFEAACTFNLEEEIQKLKKSNKTKALSKGWSILKREADGENATHDKDVLPEALYWYGMYCLQQEDATYTEKAKGLFLRASQRQDYPPHPLALHMLGWLYEQQNDLRTAERYYCYCVQLEPVEPYAYLKLSGVIHDTQQYLRVLREKKQDDMDNQLTTKKGKSKKWTVEKVDELIDETNILMLQKRQLLHDRVARLADLRSAHMKSYLEGLCVPGKFFHVDNFWLENLMTSFCVCEDWSALLKTCIEFRKK